MRPDDPRHGTNAGHRAHYTDGTEPCQPCRDAHAEYRRTLWRKKYARRVADLYIPATGTTRRIRALQRLGWPLYLLDQQLGHGDGKPRGGPNYCHNLTRQAKVHRDTAEKVARLYERLSMTLGPSPRARAVAEGAGYLPPLAWDDIDDPNERPNVTPSKYREKTDVDHAVVARVINGERLSMTRAERVEVVRRLRDDWAWSEERIEAHTGISKATNRDRYPTRPGQESAA